jgi:hypothetical protein
MSNETHFVVKTLKPRQNAENECMEGKDEVVEADVGGPAVVSIAVLLSDDG